MKTGMLWFCDPKKTLKESIEYAVGYYERKHGAVPDRCYANPSMEVPGLEIPGVEIVYGNNILNKHIWLGVTSGTNA